MTEAERPTAGHKRKVRSFVRRAGRITKAQRRAMQSLYPRFAVQLGAQLLALKDVFGGAGPVVLDIGFGDGEALAADDLTNVRSVCADAAEVLSDHLAAVNLFFPDRRAQIPA